ncbi:ABC transporter ATP-binding protein [Ruminiclostridium herbifermentans]|uniref:ABC transporter ATP-binding protein n=1 Tax=Ruminiclostridium herbifermentans TaxID=2488810 RepID=A0A4U7JJL5_9FIRM|nr:ABC transporter ATP-binding protein [Ruminiclostridium herbifermentans]QNU66226.1 ABC transporter ATP-binding protein [Ruminiclostridium herbifermentans]
MNIEEKKYSYVKTILRGMPLQFKSAPWNFLIDNLLSVTNGILLTLIVVATQNLFDAITNAASGQAGFGDCLIPLLVLAGLTFGQQIVDGIYNFHGVGVLWTKSTGRLMNLLHRKLQRIDPSKFEDTIFLDDLNKAMEGAKATTMFCMTIVIGVCYYSVFFASVGMYLFWLEPMLMFTLLMAFVPALISQIVRAKVFTKLEEQSAPLRRKYEYYQKTLCDREYFKETRILGAFKFFHNLFIDTLLLLTCKIWQAERKTALLQLLLNATSFAGMAVASYILFTATMAGKITVGAFAAVFSALGMIFYYMQEIINTHLGSMSRDIGKVANFIHMLDMPEYIGSDGNPDFSKGIVLENVSFTYPGKDTPAVKNVSLAIADRETIAIVGENGAGKSTLVRLMTGIYRPSEGKVLIGGMDTAKIAPKSVYKSISGVFQKYQRYKMTLCENVAISDTEVEEETEVYATKIEDILREVNAELSCVKLDTMLSPEFDGIDLSGGQWQQVAIARGLYRTNEFIILDEPTAAIDPIEETKVYTQFQSLTEGKCAVVVTHRLGSAKLAHRIVVMNDGKIVDMGTHEELIARPGKYADMWKAQAQWYER